jgi:pilus assembly protein CpaF
MPAIPTYKVRRQAISLDPARYQELKGSILNKLFELMDPRVLTSMPKAEMEGHLRQTAGQLLDQANLTLNRREREQFLQDIVDEVTGYGPLEPLLADPAVNDILVNGCKNVYVECNGKLHFTDVIFRDNRHLLQVIDRIVTSIGRHIDEGSAMCDARLPDGSRVNAIIPPLAIDYPVLSIRKFKKDVLTTDELVRYGTITEEIAMVLEACVKCRLNILISGGTGAGKTTLLNIMSGFIPANQRIVTIEDSAELQLQQPHVVRLETRPPNIEGRGEVTQYDLLRNSLRMRPDRIILGEVRGKEALDMLQAMNTGHDGSMCTVHSNTPRDALSRLETMIAMVGVDLPQRAMRQQISSALDVVLQCARLSDGTRKLTHLSEVLGMEGEIVTMQDIFVYDRSGVDKQGIVVGEHIPTGVQPRFVQRMKAAGIELSPALFLPKA